MKPYHYAHRENTGLGEGDGEEAKFPALSAGCVNSASFSDYTT